MLVADLGERVVRHAGDLRRAVGRRDQLDRRIGEREHLLQAVELVEQREPRVDVPQRLDARERGEHRMAGNELAEPVEKRLRHEVGEDVEHGAVPAKAATLCGGRAGWQAPRRLSARGFVDNSRKRRDRTKPRCW